jgi:hypothetical protein
MSIHDAARLDCIPTRRVGTRCQALEALESMAKQLGGTGLETWEQLARQFEQDA